MGCSLIAKKQKIIDNRTLLKIVGKTSLTS